MQCDLMSASNPPMQGMGSAEDFIYRNNVIYRPIYYNDLRIQILDLRRMTHQPDWSVKENLHPWYEFNFVSSGSAFTCIDGVEFLSQAGSFFLVPPQKLHSHRHNAHMGDSGFCLRFLLEKVDIPSSEAVYPIADQLMAGFVACAPKAYYFPADQLLRDIERSAEFQFPAVFISWLLRIYSCVFPDTQAPAVRDHDAQKAGIVRQVELYLESFFAEHFTPAELAGSLNYSYRHLSRIYKETTGCTITEKLNRIRMQKAAKLLLDSNLNMRTVSEMVGFRSYASFFKAFESFHGCAPSEFRK